MKIAILGAGYTGLELGRRLKAAGKDFIILETESQIGGICRTNVSGDYRWDFGVHALYSRSQGPRDYFDCLPIQYQHLKRNVRIFHHGSDHRDHLLDYPFEIGVKDLPFRDKWECVCGYLKACLTGKKQYGNFEDWVLRGSGYGIARHFMRPYNNKIWNCPLSEISMKLISSKIEPMPVRDFINSLVWKKTIGRIYQANFLYPQKGIQGLMDYTAKDIRDRIFLNAKVERLSRQGEKWFIDIHDGRMTEADAVVSTIPLVELVKKTDLDEFKNYPKLDLFKWNNTFFVMVGLKKGEQFNFIHDCHWVFFKEKEIFYRVALMHNLSPDFPPALVAEVTRKGRVLQMSDDEIRDAVIKDLLRLGIVGSQDQIAAADMKLLEYTYPIPTVGIEPIKKELSGMFEKYQLFLLGRNGNWDYINIDGVIQCIDEFVEKRSGFFQ